MCSGSVERPNHLNAGCRAHNPEPGLAVAADVVVLPKPAPHLRLVCGMEVDPVEALTVKMVAVFAEPGIM